MKKLYRYLMYKILTANEEYRRVAAVDDLCNHIVDFQQYLRAQWKYAETPDDIDTIYDKWFESLNSNGIDMNRIYN